MANATCTGNNYFSMYADTRLGRVTFGLLTVDKPFVTVEPAASPGRAVCSLDEPLKAVRLAAAMIPFDYWPAYARGLHLPVPADEQGTLF